MPIKNEYLYFLNYYIILLKLAILTNKPYQECETFVKAHIDKLPFAITHYFGAQFPYSVSRPKPKENIFSRVKKRIKKPKPISDLSVFINDLKKNRIEALLAEYGTVGARVFPACKELELPLIIHFHGHDAVRHRVLENFAKEYKEMFEYHKTKVVSVSKVMSDRLIKLGCPKDKIFYNTYGPADTFLSIQPTYTNCQFLSIGRFVEKKAPHLLLLAFKKVLEEFPKVNLVYAGDGKLLDSCKDLVKALHLENSVNFPGHITPEDYCKLLKNTMAYVQHSIESHDGDMEGTPVSILEASGAGLPVVSTKHAGIPDVILNNETGLLSDERNIEQMSENMMWILRNRELAKKMGLAGKKRISLKYSQQIHLDGLAKIINEAV